MKTAGEILRAARIEKNWSLEKLSKKTKIKPEFLRAVEESDIENLPAGPFVKGFIRAMAVELQLNPDGVVAIFRRDFGTDKQGRVVPVNLDDGHERRFSWSPRTTVAAAIAIVTAAFGVYLIFQLKLLVSAPELTVTYPEQDEIVTENVLVEGKTEPSAAVMINGQEIKKNRDGVFSQTILLTEGEHIITIEARGENGKITTLQRPVRVKRE